MRIRMMSVLSAVAAMAVVSASAAEADDRGRPVFADDFSAVGVFAERWLSEKGVEGSIPELRDGVIRFRDGCDFQMRGAMDLEFVVEVDVKHNPEWGKQPVPGKSGAAGFSCDGRRFGVTATGAVVCGKQTGKVAASASTGAARLRLTRKSAGKDKVVYKFAVNGETVGELAEAVPIAVPNKAGIKTFAPAAFFADGVDAEFDNFNVYAIRRDGESPNTLVNSSFEYDYEGFPCWYVRGDSFDFIHSAERSYDDWLAAWSLDTTEKHSGRQSLKIVNGLNTARSETIGSKKAAAIKGARGVLSAWMKADRADFPVKMKYGGKSFPEVVRVGTEWARYEVVCENMQGPGLRSVMTIEIPEKGTLWIDDVQTEFAAEGGATPYRPSDLDQRYFGKKKAKADLPPVTVQPAPARAVIDTFYGPHDEAPNPEVRAEVSYDDKNLYVECFDQTGKFSEMAELLIDPSGKCEPAKHYQLVIQKDGSRHPLWNRGRGQSVGWKGTWTCEVKPGYYKFVLPFSDFQDGKAVSREWLISVDMYGEKGYICSEECRSAVFRNPQTWRKLVLPKWVEREDESAAAAEAVSVMGRLSFYMNEPEAAFRVKTMLPNAEKVVLDCAGVKSEGTLGTGTPRKGEFKLPLANVPEGTNAVKVLVLDAAGKQIAEGGSTLIKRPYWEGATQVNHFSRSLLHKGKPVVPVANFIVAAYFHPVERCIGEIDTMARHGFTAVETLTDVQDPKRNYTIERHHAQIEAVFTNALNRNMTVLNWFNAYGIREDAAKMSERLKWYDYPNVLTHIVLDEPELWLTSDQARDFMRQMRPLFPYQPVQFNGTCLMVSQNYAGLETDIFMIDDYLTNSEEREVASVVHECEVIWKAGEKDGKPCYFFLVGNNMGLHGREPTYAEQISETYGCLAKGCTGFAYFYGFPGTPGNWRALKQINKELTSLTEVICSDEEAPAIECDGDSKHLLYRVFKHKDSVYIAACNIDAEDAGKVTFNLKELGVKGKVEVLFENRKVDVKDGELIDTFRGHERHVYKIEPNPAEWISDGSRDPEKTEDFYNNDPAPKFTRDFVIDDDVTNVCLRIAGLGLYRAELNGESVGRTVLTPDWTPFGKRVYFDTYDLTPQTKKGGNTLSVRVGNGWYNPLPMKMWGQFNLREAMAVGRPCLWAEIVMTGRFAGERKIVTDANWQLEDTGLLRNNLYLGEVFDAGHKPVAGKVTVVEGPAGRLVGRTAPPVVVRESWPAVSVKEIRPNVYVVDMGRNFGGVSSFKLGKGRKGERISFLYGERIYDDGSVNPMTGVCGQLKRPGLGGPGAPALAVERDEYIRSGEGDERYMPTFTWHAFRYVQIEGLASAPKAEDVVAHAWCADVQDVLEFECSNERINALHRICRNTFSSNLMGVQSDCPGRERFGYGGDIATTAEALMLNYDMREFYRKTLRDYADEAEDEGYITGLAPFNGFTYHGFGGKSDSFGWATAVPILMDLMLRYYGDMESVREFYPMCARFLDITVKHHPDLRIRSCNGDHEALEKADVKLTVMAHFHQFAALTAKFAALLGKTDDAARYEALAKRIDETFNRLYVRGGKIETGSQSAQLFGLYHGLVPADAREAARKILFDNLALHDGHLTTGIFGTQYMCELFPQFIERNIIRDEFPGFGHMVANGATTLWETWKESDNVYSQNHPMFGSVDAWIVKRLLGIRLADDAVGADKLVIEPVELKDVEWAKGTLRTVRGDVQVEWRKVAGKTEVKYTAPKGVKVERR